MSSDNEYLDDDEEDLAGEAGAAAAESGDVDGLPAAQAEKLSPRDWMKGRRGWMMICIVAVLQGIFAVIMIIMRSEAKPVVNINYSLVRDLALDALGYEVDIRQIYQLIPLRGGKRMTVGLDLILLLGQLPDEQIDGSERPNPEEFAVFTETIRAMEPNIRSQVNSLLQGMPPDAFGTAEAGKIIKDSVLKYVNDTLDGLDFAGSVRPGLGKRRVTEVLLPMFIRQMM